MARARTWIAIPLLAALSACGTGAVFESDEASQARVDAAVQAALDRERGWQTRFVERRTETMIADQQATVERIAALEQMAGDIRNRLDAIDRGTSRGDGSMTNVAAPAPAPTPAPTPTVSAPVNAVPDMAVPDKAAAAEREALRHEVAALTKAIGRLSSSDEQGAAVVRARLERLELRTSKLPWPPASNPVKAVHLASYRSHEAALAGWEILVGRYRKVLEDETPTLVEVRTVAGQYVRLFAGAGLGDRELLAIREALRDGGDYAMILPLPGGPGS